MAPAKKSRTANRRQSNVNESPSGKSLDTPSKKSNRKRKLTEMLGPQWTKEELERFYKTYRKNGPDWEKVAAAVGSRSVEMVEALYTMNRAYLSLPKGYASAAGLIAMMTDHYANMGVSDNEDDFNNVSESSRKSQKRPRGTKIAEGTLATGASISLPDSSDEGCLSLLKKRRYVSKPWAVGKRTPRVPVSFSCYKDNEEHYFSPARRLLRLKSSPLEDDVAHEIALALAGASKGASSPEVSRTTKKKSLSCSPVKNREHMQPESLMTSAKVREHDIEEGDCELSLGSTDADVGCYSRDKGSLKRRKDKIKQEMDEAVNNHVDDIKEACSGTEEGQTLGTGKEKMKIDNFNKKVSKASNKVSKKKSKKLDFGEDENICLQALADLSLRLPGADTGSSVDVKDESIASMSKSKSIVNHSNPGLLKTVKQESNSANNDASVAKDLNEVPRRGNAARKRRQKPSEDNKAVEENLHEAKEKGNENDREHSTLGDPKKPTSYSPSHDVAIDSNTMATSTVRFLPSNETTTKSRSRRKPCPPKLSGGIGAKFSSATFEENSWIHKDALANSLSRYQVRRWCTYEWFYSAIDHPWFSKREFVEYLDHVGLGHIPKLTHVEWGVIRSSLGKPRRFSQQFLKEEKEKLNQYRESVRKHYSDIRLGKQDGLPTELGRPLCVGQRVIALHPKTREIHDGSVLTVEHNRCRIQFDQPQLGVEFVMDVDCMPSGQFEHANPLISSLTCEAKSHGSPAWKKNFAATLFQQPKGVDAKNNIIDPVVGHPPSINSNGQVNEADILAISELTRALDKKEAVLSELQRMNDEITENQKQEDFSLVDLEPFKKHYAAVILQLSEVNEQVASALMCLRKRNTYQATSSPSWLKAVNDLGQTLPIDGTHETTSYVVEIVESSRSKAQSMVAAALNALPLSFTNDAVHNMEDAIDFVNNRLSLDDRSIPAARSPPNPGHDQSSTTTEDAGASLNDQDGGLTSCTNSNGQLPSHLITECVATMLMIQRCTERQFPPSDVAKVLDSAVTNLKPRCPQNIPIYAEIQKCMGILKNQILALVPT